MSRLAAARVGTRILAVAVLLGATTLVGQPAPPQGPPPGPPGGPPGARGERGGPRGGFPP